MSVGSYSITSQRFDTGPSLVWCEKLDPENCAQVLDDRLYSAQVWIDFGQQVNVTSFVNHLPQSDEAWPAEEYMGCLDIFGGGRLCDSNRRETLGFFRAPGPSPDSPFAEIEVTEADQNGLHAEFAAISTRYLLWSTSPEFRYWEEDWGGEPYIWRELVQPNNGRIHGLRFYGEPVPEPSSFALLGSMLATGCLARLVRARVVNRQC